MTQDEIAKLADELGALKLEHRLLCSAVVLIGELWAKQAGNGELREAINTAVQIARRSKRPSALASRRRG
jgi:hypothetical protein